MWVLVPSRVIGNAPCKHSPQTLLGLQKRWAWPALLTLGSRQLYVKHVLKVFLHLCCKQFTTDPPHWLPPRLLIVFSHVAKPSEDGGSSHFLEVIASVQGKSSTGITSHRVSPCPGGRGQDTCQHVASPRPLAAHGQHRPGPWPLCSCCVGFGGSMVHLAPTPQHAPRHGSCPFPAPQPQHYGSLFRDCCAGSGKFAKASSVNKHWASYRLMHFNFHASMCPPVRQHLGENVSVLLVISFLLTVFVELFLGLELRKTFAPFGSGRKGWCSSLFRIQESVGVFFLSFKCAVPHLLARGTWPLRRCSAPWVVAVGHRCAPEPRSCGDMRDRDLGNLSVKDPITKGPLQSSVWAHCPAACRCPTAEWVRADLNQHSKYISGYKTGGRGKAKCELVLLTFAFE